MVKTVIIRKRTIFIYGLLVLVLAIGVVVLETFINKSNNDEYITYAQAAKMIAYANVDDTQAFETGEVWYKPYIEYVNINGYMQCCNYSVKYILSLSCIHFPLTNIKLRRCSSNSKFNSLNLLPATAIRQKQYVIIYKFLLSHNSVIIV